MCARKIISGVRLKRDCDVVSFPPCGQKRIAAHDRVATRGEEEERVETWSGREHCWKEEEERKDLQLSTFSLEGRRASTTLHAQQEEKRLGEATLPANLSTHAALSKMHLVGR